MQLSNVASRPIKLSKSPLSPHTIEILKGLRDRYEAHHRVTITDQALVAAANLADRYIADRYIFRTRPSTSSTKLAARLRIKRMETPPELQGDSKTEDRRLSSDSKKQAVEDQAFRTRRISCATEEKELLDQRSKQWKVPDQSIEGVDLFDEVDEEAIAEVLSIWTGIPGLQAH